MRKYLLCLLFILLILPFQNAFCVGKYSIGGITFKHAAAIGLEDPAPYGDFTTLVVPIKRAGNLIIVEAQLDTIEGNFVMDTGAPYLVLNSTYFRDATHIADQQAGGINGESTGTFTTMVRNFSILDLHYSRLTADVTDLSAIENGRGLKILGLLGTRLFSKFAVTVDMNSNLMYIQKVDSKGEIPLAERVFKDPYMVSPLRITDDIIFIKANVNNRKAWFVFDTGAESNLLDYSRMRKSLQTMQIINRTKLTGIGGSSFEVLYARFDNLQIGDRNFMGNHVLVTDLEKMGKAYDHTIDGILGYDFFSRGIFTINFVKSEFEMYIYNNQQQ
jgi:hypothetical protein